MNRLLIESRHLALVFIALSAAAACPERSAPSSAVARAPAPTFDRTPPERESIDPHHPVQVSCHGIELTLPENALVDEKGAPAHGVLTLAMSHDRGLEGVFIDITDDEGRHYDLAPGLYGRLNHRKISRLAGWRRGMIGRNSSRNSS